MAVAGRLGCFAAFLFLAHAAGHNHNRVTEMYDVSAGRLLLLSCGGSEGRTNATWSREGGTNMSLPPGVEVREGALWFLPAQVSHNGTYICEYSDQRESWEMEFRVLVSSEQCPRPAESRSIIWGTSDFVPCKQPEILRLDSDARVRWLKDCGPVHRRGAEISVDRQGNMRLPAAADEDAGKYTCLVEISLEGRKYTAARSFLLNVHNDTVFFHPRVVYPKQQTVAVELGSRVEVKCLAFVGYNLDEETLMHWTINGDYSDEYEQFNDSKTFYEERGKVFRLSTLTISGVLPEFLNVPICCHVENPFHQDNGLLWLQKADHSHLHTSVALCLVSSLAVLAAIAVFLFFRVDLVLAYRKLCPHLAKQKTPHGKLYDAYVSYLHTDGPSSSQAETFALQILPEVLEKKHGFSLYIRGRDDCPGEAVHDILAAMVRKSHRFVIILSAQIQSSTDGRTEETMLFQNLNQLCYEQKVGLFDALTQSGPQVILVEIDGPVDYSGLPESLRYIKKKQGALRWRTAASSSNRVFWKNLRYHMPPAPAGRCMTVV